jgi:hypothetical protein
VDQHHVPACCAAIHSRSILYIKNEGGISNIWSQPISGGAAKKITHFNPLSERRAV